MDIASFNDLSAAALLLLWKATWQGGIALLLVLLVARVLRQIPARVQCWLWRLAFLKLLIAGVAIASIELPWLPPATSSVHPIPVAVMPPSPPEEAMIEQPPFDFPTEDQTPVTAAVAVTPRPLSEPRLSIASWLVIVWLTGVAACSVHLLRQWVRVRRLVAGLGDFRREQLQLSPQENCRRMRVSVPELRVSDDLGGPCLIGVLHPVIVLPSTLLNSCSAEALNAALLHELAHIKRCDLLWNWLPALAEVFFYFHPLVWLARREWRLAQEIATDELALSVSQVDVAQYARLLMELVAKCQATSIRPHLAVGVSETYSQLSRRMTAVLSLQNHSTRRRMAIAASVLTIAIFGVVPWRLTTWHVEAKPLFPQTGELQTDQNGPTPEGPEETIPGETVQIDSLKSKLEVTEQTAKVIEFKDWLTHVDGFDPKVINVTVLEKDELRVEGLKQGVTTMVVTDRSKQVQTIEVLVLGLINASPVEGSPDVPPAVSDREINQTTDELFKLFAAAEFFWQQGDVARKLIARQDKGIIPRMEQFLEVSDRHRRCNAALVLAGLGNKRGLTILIRELEDQQPRPTERTGSDGRADLQGQIREDRYYAAMLLGQLGSKDAVPALITATKDKSINYQAAISLGDIGDKSAIPALQQMLKDFPDQRLWAGYGLAKLGEKDGFDILEGSVRNDTKWTERRHAIEALGKIGDSKCVPVLTKALKDEHANVRVSAARALAEIGDASALPALMEALKDREATEVNAPTTVAEEAQKAINAFKRKEIERHKRETNALQERGEAEEKKKPQGFQQIIAARPAPDLTTLVARSSPDIISDDSTESFWDLLKLREKPDPKTIPVLEKILIENIPTTRIHGFAAAQVLFAIGTPEALQVLDRNILTSNVRANLAIGYTPHWEMKEPQRSQFIDKYLLKNLSKDLLIEVAQDDEADSKPGQTKLNITVRNASDAAFHIVELKGTFELLHARDQTGRIIFDASPKRIHGPRTSKMIELKPGQTDSATLTLNVTKEDGKKTIVEVPETGQRFETADRCVDFVAMLEVQPLHPDQRTFMKVDDSWPWWTGRAVSKWFPVDLGAASAK